MKLTKIEWLQRNHKDTMVACSSVATIQRNMRTLIVPVILYGKGILSPSIFLVDREFLMNMDNEIRER